MFCIKINIRKVTWLNKLHVIRCATYHQTKLFSFLILKLISLCVVRPNNLNLLKKIAHPNIVLVQVGLTSKLLWNSIVKKSFPSNLKLWFFLMIWNWINLFLLVWNFWINKTCTMSGMCLFFPSQASVPGI